MIENPSLYIGHKTIQRLISPAWRAAYTSFLIVHRTA